MHRVRSGALLDTYVRVARDYRGRMEVDASSLVTAQKTSQTITAPATATVTATPTTVQPSEPTQTETETAEGSEYEEDQNENKEKQFWAKTGVTPDLQVTATNIRKWIVTVCHQRKCEGASFDESVIRRAMCHSDRVAQSHYLRDDLTAVGAKAIDIIALCTQRGLPKVKDLQKAGTTTVKTATFTAHDAQQDSDAGGDQEEQARALTDHEEVAIQELFKEQVVEDVRIHLQQVRQKMIESPGFAKTHPV